MPRLLQQLRRSSPRGCSSVAGAAAAAAHPAGHPTGAAAAAGAPAQAGDASVSQQQQQQQQQQLRQWSQQSSIYYAQYPLHRAAEARRQPEQLAAWFADARARITPVNGSKVLLAPAPTAPTTTATTTTSSSSSSSASLAPVWITPAGDLAGAIEPGSQPMLLGLDDNGVPHFAARVSPAGAEEVAAAHPGARWAAARAAGPDMASGDASLMAVVSGLAAFNAAHAYHGATGAKTEPEAGGFARRCSVSSRSVYPRIDPAIITLVTSGTDWCLLGRKPDWPAGRYSTLAGFLEVGETLEQALCREVLEESAVAADLRSVRYVASQPWPFPQSLMVGFYARAPLAGGAGSSSGTSSSVAEGQLSHEGRMAMMDTGLRPDEVADALQALQLQQPRPQKDEMEDVRWFHREWLVQTLQQQQGSAVLDGAELFIPGPYSLAHKLITAWLSSGSTSSTSGGSWAGSAVPQVQLDSGSQKYVLLRLRDAASGASKLLVRGSTAAAYHNHILQATKAQLAGYGAGELQLDVLGGGRIEHAPQERTSHVFGYSAAFGPAVHEVTAGLLRKWHPMLRAVTHSYEGY